MSNRAIIVQARLGSTRLPNKLMRKLNGESVLEFLLKRLQHVALVDQLILVTTTLKEDDVIESAAAQLKIPAVRGSVTNVLDRFYQAVLKFNIDVIVRICADNLFLEPSEIARLLKLQQQKQYDYAANCLPDKTPLILTGIGMAVEVFTRPALEKALDHDMDSYHKEHVTPFFYEHPELFNIVLSVIPFAINKNMRLTLDTAEDFNNFKIIYQNLFPNFNLQNIINYLEHSPEMVNRMQQISRQQQKGR